MKINVILYLSTVEVFFKRNRDFGGPIHFFLLFKEEILILQGVASEIPSGAVTASCIILVKMLRY